MDIGRREPTSEELLKIKQTIPLLKKQAAEKAKKNGTVRSGIIGRMIDPAPCQICIKAYDRYNGGKEKHDICPPCRKNLADGQTCFFSVDGRHIFSVPDNVPEALALAGKVVKIPSELMDKLVEQFEGKEQK